MGTPVSKGSLFGSISSVDPDQPPFAPHTAPEGGTGKKRNSATATKREWHHYRALVMAAAVSSQMTAAAVSTPQRCGKNAEEAWPRVRNALVQERLSVGRHALPAAAAFLAVFDDVLIKSTLT